MTKEIWTTIITAIAQICAAVLLVKWQIVSAKALMNPQVDQAARTKGVLLRAFNWAESKKLYVIIPLIIYACAITSIISRSGLTIFTLGFSAMVLIFAAFHFLALSFLECLLGDKGVIPHLMNRLLCHESILFKLADKPCKEDGICKFKA